jgi:hypothetical protein
MSSHVLPPLAVNSKSERKVNSLPPLEFKPVIFGMLVHLSNQSAKSHPHIHVLSLPGHNIQHAVYDTGSLFSECIHFLSFLCHPSFVPILLLHRIRWSFLCLQKESIFGRLFQCISIFASNHTESQKYFYKQTTTLQTHINALRKHLRI